MAVDLLFRSSDGRPRARYSGKGKVHTGKLRVGLLAALLLSGLSAGSAASSAPKTLASNALGAQPGSLTLITGDHVEVRADGVPPDITPATGRTSMPFRVTRSKGHLRVVPGDAAALVAAGRLDERLFDVTALLDSGYGDAQQQQLPLIVQYDTAAPRPAVPAGSLVRQLPSVNSVAVSVSKKAATAWWATTTRIDHGKRTLAAEYRKVWLDGKRNLALDHSAVQIGAPAAWQAGLTGAGVRVAIIDSGIDGNHPDLTGKVAASANFTNEPPGDLFGHGTHVASIVAGSGAASGGKFRGIAPDARLLDAKVCTADGCPEDAILAGMQWAAATQHAAVANMSLGGPDTPGVDPVEQAVNTLSAQYGTLFVIAAGNSGPGEDTIESPGSADRALTVGAVDREDVVADFSSRGPRTGDAGLKPDIVAPGVDIVAARGDDTELGEVVDRQYVRLSGTSMATPHVAGAAAIVLQQHPDWSNEQVKAVLMGSAKTLDGVSVLDQGAGRTDIAKAISQTVTAEPSSLSFGLALWPHTDDRPLSKAVTYRNTASRAVTLDLALQVTGPDTAPAPVGLFAVNPSTLVVPAGGTAQAVVTADTRPAEIPVGRYSGRLLASGVDAAVTTPLAVEKESEHYDLQITHIGRDGRAPGSYVTFVDRVGDCGTDVFCGGIAFGSDENSALRLPAGQYTVAEFSTTAGREDMNLLMRPTLDLTTNMSMTVDARRAKPVEMTAPRKSARLMQFDLNVARDMHRPNTVFFYSVSGDYTVPLYTADLGGKPAGKDDIVSFVQGRLAEPGPTDDYTASPYEYELAKAVSGRLFTGLQLRPQQQDFATVQAQYAAVTSQPRDVKTEHSAKPTSGRPELLDFFPSFGANRLIAKPPFHRTEYYLAAGLQWISNMQQGDRETGAVDYLLAEDQWHIYQPGRTYQQPRWGQGVFGPHFRQPRYFATQGAANGVMRQGDHFAAGIDMFVDSDPGHVSQPKATGSFSQARLYRDGQRVQDWPFFSFVATDLPPEEATYRLEATVTPPFSEISTTVTSAWTFRSGHVDGTEAVALPLLGVRYNPDLDERNHARPGQQFTVPVEITRQPGTGPANIEELTVEASYDDGVTWQTMPVIADGARWLATVDNPVGGVVSLRTRATDTEGNQLEQTTIRAYLVSN